MLKDIYRSIYMEEMLSKELYRGWDDACRDSFVQGLVAFMREWHSQEIEGEGVTAVVSPEELADKLNPRSDHLRFCAIYARMVQSPFEKRVLHGALRQGSIWVDTLSGNLVKVDGREEGVVGDPYIDFCHLIDIDQDLARDVVKEWAHQVGSQPDFARVAVYHRAFQLSRLVGLFDRDERSIGDEEGSAITIENEAAVVV